MAAFLVDDEWPFAVESGGMIVRTTFAGAAGSWPVLMRIRSDQAQIAIYSLWGEHVAPERRPAVTDYLMRANYGLIIGNFEMDVEDGEVRFKVALDVEGVDLDRPRSAPVGPLLVRQAIYANVLTFDRYLPGVERVAGGEDPGLVIEDVENAKNDPVSPEDDTDA